MDLIDYKPKYKIGDQLKMISTLFSSSFYIINIEGNTHYTFYKVLCKNKDIRLYRACIIDERALYLGHNDAIEVLYGKNN